MATTVSTAEVLVKWQQQGLPQVQAASKGLGASFDSLSKKATAAGQKLSIAFTAPLLAAGKAMVENASDLSESQNAVNAIFDQSASSIQKFATTANTSLGISRQAALQASVGFGALFKNIGLGDAVAADWSKNVLQMSADLGSFLNLDPTEAAAKIKAGLAGESEGLKSMNIFLTEASVQAKAVQLGLAGANGEISEGAKVQARYALIVEQAAFAQGDFAKTSGGLANSSRILKASLTDLSAQLGQVLLPYINAAVLKLQQMVDWAMNLSPEMQRMGIIFGAVAAALGPALLILGQFAGAIGNLAPLIGLLTGPLGLVAVGIAALGLAWKNNWFGIRDHALAVIDRLAPAFNRMVTFFTHAKERGLDPFELAMRTLEQGADEFGLEGVSDALKEVERLGRRIFENLSNGDFSGLAKTLQRATDGLEDWFADRIKDAQTFVADFIREFAPAPMKGVLLALIGIDEDADISNDIKAFFNKTDWDQLGKDIRTTIDSSFGEVDIAGEPNFQKMMDDLVANTQSELETLKDIGGWANNQFIASDWDAASRTLGDQGVLFGRQLWENTEDELTQLQKAGQWVADNLGTADWAAIGVEQNNRGSDLGLKLMEGIQAGQDEKWPALQAWFASLPTNIAAAVDSVGPAVTALLQKGTDLLAGLLQGVADKWPDIETFFINLPEAVLQATGEASVFLTTLLNHGGSLLQGFLDGMVAKLIDLATWLQNLGNAVLAAVPDMGDLLLDTGRAFIQGLWDGAVERWNEFTAWVSTLTPPPLPGLSGADQVAPAVHGSGGKQENVPTGWGGRLSTGSPFRTTMVGEYGPEMVMLPPGAMVMPHGASQARYLASRGMALGGLATSGAMAVAQRIMALKGRRGERTPASLVARARELEARFFGGANITSGMTPGEIDSLYSRSATPGTANRLGGSRNPDRREGLGWEEWLAAQPRATRDAIRAWRIRNGNLAPEIKRSLMSGGMIQGMGLSAGDPRWSLASARAGTAPGMASGGTVQSQGGNIPTGGFGSSGGGGALAAAFQDWLQRQNSTTKKAVAQMQNAGTMTAAIRQGLINGTYLVSRHTGEIVTRAQENALDRQASNEAAARAAETARQAEQARQQALAAQTAAQKRDAERRVQEASMQSEAERVRTGRTISGRPQAPTGTAGRVTDDPGGLTGNPFLSLPAGERSAETRRLARFLGEGPNELLREYRNYNGTLLSGLESRAPKINEDLEVGSAEDRAQRDKFLRYYWKALLRQGKNADDIRRAIVQGKATISFDTGAVEFSEGVLARHKKHRRGAALGRVITVGESGPEAVVLPMGSMVQPHGAHRARLDAEYGDRGAGGSINVYGNVTVVAKTADLFQEITSVIDARNR